jgi:hypothetical protein
MPHCGMGPAGAGPCRTHPLQSSFVSLVYNDAVWLAEGPFA